MTKTITIKCDTCGNQIEEKSGYIEVRLLNVIDGDLISHYCSADCIDKHFAERAKSREKTND